MPLVQFGARGFIELEHMKKKKKVSYPKRGMRTKTNNRTTKKKKR